MADGQVATVNFERETQALAHRHPAYDLDLLRETVLEISRHTSLAVWAVLDQMGWWMERGADLVTVRAWYLGER